MAEFFPSHNLAMGVFAAINTLWGVYNFRVELCNSLIKYKGVVLKVVQKFIFFYIYIFCLWSGISFAENKLENASLLSDSFLSSLDKKTENKTVLKYGKIEGQIFVPEGIDPTTILVQVSGVVNFNSTAEDFYQYADSNGHFVFENTFTTGSSLILFFSDRNGLLNKRSLLVNISENSGIYTVYLERNSVTTALSEAFGTPQSIAKAGLCGRITGLSTFETTGAEVYLQDSKDQMVFSAKYFNNNNLPDLQQNFLSENGNFCFFNVESTDNSFLYFLRLKLNNGVFKTFFVYLPFDSFATSIEFDAKSELFRPIQFYSENPLYNVNFSTSSDYSSVLLDNNNSKDAFYLPLGDEFLNINYRLEGENQQQFFIFQPRNSLLTKNLLNSVEDFSPGQTYVDKYEPLALKVFDSKLIPADKLNLLSNPDVGSVILNIDISHFYFDNKKIKIYLKNISGEDVSSFIPLENDINKKEISGIFFNIPEGIYQVFVTVPTSISNCDNCTTYNFNEKLLWSSIVESLENKTQFLTNISENKEVIENKLSPQEKNDVFISKQESLNSERIAVEIIPYEFNYGDAIYKQIIPTIPDLDYLETHSLFYSINEKNLCSIPNEKQNLFMNLVPIVSIIKNGEQNSALSVNDYQFNNELQFIQTKNSERPQTPADAKIVSGIEKRLTMENHKTALYKADGGDTSKSFILEIMPWYII
ncbi:MAG: hypothetical protein V4591_00185 [Bdellovibrionota bacterium]